MSTITTKTVWYSNAGSLYAPISLTSPQVCFVSLPPSPSCPPPFDHLNFSKTLTILRSHPLEVELFILVILFPLNLVLFRIVRQFLHSRVERVYYHYLIGNAALLIVEPVSHDLYGIKGLVDDHAGDCGDAELVEGADRGCAVVGEEESGEEFWECKCDVRLVGADELVDRF